MKRFRLVSPLVLVIAAVLIFAACDNQQNVAESAVQGQMTQATQETGITEAGEATVVSPGPLGRYDPPITVTSVRWDVAAGVQDLIPDGDSVDNNAWTRAFYNHLGVILEYDWIVPADQYDQRFGLAVASGDLPDVLNVNMTQLRLLMDNDMLADLTNVFQNYASTQTYDIIMQDGGSAIRTATFNDRLMAIPQTDSITDGAQVIWIRQDWLNELSLSTPQTIDELIDVAAAFVDADLSGRGTFGFGVHQGALIGYSGWADVAGFFYGYHAHFDGWIRDDAGNLVYGGVQPQTRVVLKRLSDLFQMGLIDPEFGIKDSGMIGEDAAAGRIGIVYGAMWNPLWPLNMSKDADADADWISIPMVSVDNQPAVDLLSNPVDLYMVVNRNFANPEAAVRMINLWTDLFFGMDTDHTVYGGELHHLNPFKVWTPTKNIDIHLNVTEALRTGDFANFDAETMLMYEHVSGWLDGNDDTLSWGYYLVFGPNGSQGILNQIFRDRAWVFDEFFGPPTPTMVNRQAILNDLKEETFMRIVMGVAPIDEFDVFVEQWHNLGGAEITEEVNAWFQSLQ